MRFFAQLTDGCTIHTVADRMELDRENNVLLAYDGNRLVAVADVSTVLYAHMAQKKDAE